MLSAYPLGTGLLVVPYYAVVRAASGRRDDAIFRSLRLEKHAAALLATLSVALFFVGTRRWSRFRHRLAAAATLALATQWLPTTSQALWSFTGAAVFGTAALALGAVRGSGLDAPAAAGVASALALFARPSAVTWLPLVRAAVPSTRRKQVALAATLVAIAVAVAALHLALYGNALGGYARIQQEVLARDAQPYPVRLAGVLASPSRGLIWFFPALLVAAPLALSGRRSPRVRRIAVAAIVSATAVVLLNAAWPAWWGGHGHGPRLLTELSIPFALLAGLALARTDRPIARRALFVLLLFQGIVSFALARSENARRWNQDALGGRPPHADLWSLRNSQLLAALWPGWSWRPPTRYLHPTLDSGWLPLDLAPAANASYSEAAAAGDPTTLRLPRLAAALANPAASTGFRLLPAGPAAAIRVCAGESSAAVAMPPGSSRRLATIVVWMPRGRAGYGERIGELVLHREGGAQRPLPLRAGQELFAADPSLRAENPPRLRLVGGEPGAADALVVQRFRVPPAFRDVRTVVLRVRPDAAGGCLYWLAASVDPIRERRAQ